MTEITVRTRARPAPAAPPEAPSEPVDTSGRRRSGPCGEQASAFDYTRRVKSPTRGVPETVELLGRVARERGQRRAFVHFRGQWKDLGLVADHTQAMDAILAARSKIEARAAQAKREPARK